jgi:thioredoxin-like negative regulator of GroEL
MADAALFYIRKLPAFYIFKDREPIYDWFGEISEKPES